MKHTLTTLFLISTFFLHSAGQSDPKKIYQQAFAEQVQMLKGQKPINFKRAVFLTENSFFVLLGSP